MDENSELLVATEHGIGIVLDRDLESVVPALVDETGTPLSEDDLERIVDRFQNGHEALLWVRYRDANVKVEAIRSTDVPRRFDFVATPGAAAGG
jgi:hypothetical protein